LAKAKGKVVRSKTLDVVAKTTTAISARLSKHIMLVQSRLDYEQSQKEAKAARDKERQDRRIARQEQRLKSRLPLALKGTRNILKFVQSDEMVKLFSTLIKTNLGLNPKIQLYSATRPSGDAFETKGKEGSGTRDVTIDLCEWGFDTFAGSGSSGNGEIVGFAFSQTDEEILKNLEQIASPNYINIFSVREQKNKFDLEWDPHELLFQVLISCAQTAVLERLIIFAMHELELEVVF